ncbi:MAG: heavy-metal-associated domain-containing protein [Bacteroidota bacterium]
MTTKELKIEGMHCGHCVMAVRKELSKLPNVTVEDVQIGTARVKLDETNVTRESIARAIDEAGYRLVAVQ